jgi:hypothetical protein
MGMVLMLVGSIVVADLEEAAAAGEGFVVHFIFVPHPPVVIVIFQGIIQCLYLIT